LLHHHLLKKQLLLVHFEYLLGFLEMDLQEVYYLLHLIHQDAILHLIHQVLLKID
tara:strand:- start:134 stop:298 length:165 start_codon:yes stop_codon:yes gene_type:complete